MVGLGRGLNPVPRLLLAPVPLTIAHPFSTPYLGGQRAHTPRAFTGLYKDTSDYVSAKTKC